MKQQQKGKITLDLEEFENFKSICDRYNVEFQVIERNELFIVTAPLDKLEDWGYLEEEPD
jgi:hypothetical protein